ncbi:hypothetical protein VZG28_05210 [Synechococcus elongatus IITB4]|uniref:hypothetical protein n=1 Tax=Synechococcus elongatus TaxID=32046 RepID=UPI0030D4F1E2
MDINNLLALLASSAGNSDSTIEILSHAYFYDASGAFSFSASAIDSALGGVLNTDLVFVVADQVTENEGVQAVTGYTKIGGSLNDQRNSVFHKNFNQALSTFSNNNNLVSQMTALFIKARRRDNSSFQQIIGSTLLSSNSSSNGAAVSEVGAGELYIIKGSLNPTGATKVVFDNAGTGADYSAAFRIGNSATSLSLGWSGSSGPRITITFK